MGWSLLEWWTPSGNWLGLSNDLHGTGKLMKKGPRKERKGRKKERKERKKVRWIAGNPCPFPVGFREIEPLIYY
jgi:hypothetical protein